MAKKKTYSISISYPPLDSPKGKPFLSQNRQFQWTNTQNIIFPVVLASAATLINKNGFKVFWDDAIAENINFDLWLERLIKNKPDLIVIESKTPVIKKHWQIIKIIKSKLKNTKIVLIGDHVTALPKESLLKCPVDFILTGGDYDFMLLNLVKHLTQNEKLKPGFWYFKNKKISNSGSFNLIHHNLDSLPAIDRKLTHWDNYAFDNANFKYKPGAYVMAARDCWWGQCTFCSWTTLYPHKSFRSFSVQHVINEIENLVNNFNVQEFFDDSGTFPTGNWLKEFCKELIKRGLNKKIRIGCNMRFGALSQDEYKLMSKAGFRLILFGLESINQKTLNKINKNLIVNDIKKTLEMLKTTQIEPHITVMIGYPWETLKDAQNTLDFAKKIFKEGLADSIQATIIIPYPNTPLFKECKKNSLLLTENWEDYDMQNPIIKSSISISAQKKLIQDFYKSIITPKFLVKKIFSIRTPKDIQYFFGYAVKFLKKLKDFS